ncbi:AraC family transcriptional regulator N-terminal domain-containing protein [Bacillus coreaensis]
MFKEIHNYRGELTKLIKSHTSQDGGHETAISYLFFSRYSNEAGPFYGVTNPSLCIVVQGMKEVLLSQELFRYGPADYLISSVNLPIIGQLTEASSEVPYLALKLEFTPNEILEVLGDFQIGVNKKENKNRGMYVNLIELPLLEAVTRLVRLLDHPEDIPILSPLIKKEIIYRVLKGRHGDALGQIAVEGSSTYQISDAIEHIMNHFDRPIRVEELAEIANMGVSSLHRLFKEVTAMSPIQFQKQLRLQEARHLLLTEAAGAADVAFRVGYESPSQFSREYSRLFGLPPKEDIKRLKETYDKKKNA